jgi:O-antigen/teichoic acid export membrane protein
LRLRESTATRDGLWVLAGQGVATLIALGMDSLLFRNLPQADRGTLSAALGLRNILLYVADMGLALATVRVASGYYGRGERDKAAAVFRRAMNTRCFLAILVAGLTALLAPVLCGFPLAAPGRMKLVYACAASLLGMSATSWGVDVAQATRRFGFYFAHQTVESALRAGAVVALFYLLAKDVVISVELVLWALAIAATLAGLFSLFLQRKDQAHAPLDSAANDELIAQLRAFGRYAWAIALLQTVSAFVELFIVQWRIGANETAIFEGARRLASILPLLGGALVTVLLPRAALLDSATACSVYVRKSLLASSAMALVFAGGLALSSGILVPLLWGHRYDASIPALRWLCLAHAFSIVINPLALVLFPLQRLGLLLVLNLSALALQIALGLWLIPQNGAMGAAWSTLAAKAITMILFSVAVTAALRRGVSAPENASGAR